MPLLAMPVPQVALQIMYKQNVAFCGRKDR
jgi:hypothetical protein